MQMKYTGSPTGDTLTDLYMEDPQGGTAPIAHEDASGNVTWLIASPNGSVQDVVTNAGAVSDSVLFDAFGKKQIVDSNATLESVYGFQGMMQILSSTPSGIASFGLDYAKERWVDPNGGFISQDPKGFAAGDPNLYRLDGNNPVNNSDPERIGGGNKGDASQKLQLATNEYIKGISLGPWTGRGGGGAGINRG